jgi:glycosyl transferase, family 25
MTVIPRNVSSLGEDVSLSRVVAFVINLDRSPERLAAMASQLDALQMPFTRVPAVDARVVCAKGKFDAQRYRLRHGRELRMAEVGCYLSHLAAMQAFLATDARYALILEDDATLLPTLPDVLAQATSGEAASTWDVLKLESRRRGFKLALHQLTPKHAISVNLFRSTGSAAYVVTRHAAEVYLDRLLPISQPFDHAFDRAWFFSLRMREVSPLVVSAQIGENAGNSTINSLSAPVVKLTGLAKLPCLAFRTLTETVRVVSGISAWTARQVPSWPRAAV